MNSEEKDRIRRVMSWQAMLASVGTYDNEAKDKLGRPIIDRSGQARGSAAFDNYAIQRAAFNR